MVSPIWNWECITLSAFCGVHIDLSGLSFQRISIPTFAPIAFFVELKRFIAAAVEIQIGLNAASRSPFHRVSGTPLDKYVDINITNVCQPNCPSH